MSQNKGNVKKHRKTIVVYRFLFVFSVVTGTYMLFLPALSALLYKLILRDY